ncbi:MAG TPA: VWA domain-containing protein [Thermoanaerobaculia bacterium]|nr:VWA domain-containing protein [Thermoanaerobaculia bacterium]
MKRISTILLVLLAGTAAMAQTFGEKIDVNVVLLDAIVTDSSGRQILGLGPQDFVVTENGVPQEIQSVDYFTNRRMVDTPESKAAVKVERMRDDRYFVLFFDKPSDGVLLSRLVHARAAALDFVNDMKPGDLVAVAGHDVRLKVYSDFTNDKRQLTRALDDAVAFGRGLTEPPPATSATPSILRTINRNRMISHTGTVYEGLEVLADALRPIKARKDVVLFSAGILTPDQIVRQGVALNRSRFYDRAVYALNTADVSLYPANIVDTPNLSPLFHQALEELASDTNGEYFRFNTTFTGALRRVEQTTNGYYLISYTTKKPRGTTGFQKVQVTVRNPDFKVRAREGYSYGS